MAVKYCVNCGNQLPTESAKFCAECGAPQSGASSQTVESPIGYSPIQNPPYQEMTQCPQCRGKGKVGFRQCNVCIGTGQVSLARRDLHRKEQSSASVQSLVALIFIVAFFCFLFWLCSMSYTPTQYTYP